MSLNDIQTELESIKSNSVNINDISQKTIQDILKNNVERLEKFMDSKVIRLYESCPFQLSKYQLAPAASVYID